MTQSPSDESPSADVLGASERNLQPFFVLHKASARKPEKRVTVTGKARRRIDLSPGKSKRAESSEAESGDGTVDRQMENLKMDAFKAVWSKIELTIQDVLRKFNVDVFDDIHKWVRKSFEAIKSCPAPGLNKAYLPFPIITDATFKKLFVGLVLTKNMDFVDDLSTFQDFGAYLKSHGFHVASLSSLDFSIKAGVGGCLRSLLRQFLIVTTDAADISVLASWYREQGDPSRPIVIIIDDLERCSGSTLAAFILLLSEWVLKLPIILVMGVSTTVDAARDLLPSNVLQHLSPSQFVLGSPAEKMDAIVKAVLVNQHSDFNIGYKVGTFMRSYFLKQDGTLTSFIRALKIACVQQFSRQPFTYGLCNFLLAEDTHGFMSDKRSLSEAILKNKIVDQSEEKLSHALRDIRRSKNSWSSVLMCLHEAGKSKSIRLLDLFCEALDPELDKSLASIKKPSFESDFGIKPCNNLSAIHQAMNRVRDLPIIVLSKLLESWEKHTADIHEIHEKVKEVRCAMESDDGNGSKQEPAIASKRITSRSYSNTGSKLSNDKAATLIKSLVGDYLRPIECMEHHEVVCFRNAENLFSALIGDPRRQIQVDLLDVQKILKCKCCCKRGNILLPTMHDTSIMYNLAQEHGDVINLHDWYQSFKTVINPTSRGKSKTRKSSTPKKRKTREGEDGEPVSISEATIQARFCRAVTELQITGLLRTPSKRRPDYVQRVAFGL